MPTKTFKVRVAYDNAQWTAEDIADYIQSWVASGQGSMHPEHKPNITEVTVTPPPVRKNAASR